MGIAGLVFGLALFLGPHAFATNRGARAAAVARWGEGPYKLAFTLFAVGGLALIGYSYGLYRETGWVALWTPPAWTRHLAVALMWPACVFVIAAYMPGHIKRLLVHPMLTGVALWAGAHLLANGDLGSVLLFGMILVWAVLERIALRRSDAAGDARPPAAWRNDVGAIAVGTLVYLALGFTFHPLVIGVPAFAA